LDAELESQMTGNATIPDRLNGSSPRGPLPSAPRFSDVDLADHFGAFLIDENIITSQVLDRARRAARSTGERFDRVLTKLGFISEAELAGALSRYLSEPLATVADVPAEQVMPDIIRPDFVRRNRVMPLAVNGGIAVRRCDGPFQRQAASRPHLSDQPLTVAARIFVPADFDKAYETLYVDPAAESWLTEGEEIMGWKRWTPLIAPAPNCRKTAAISKLHTAA
jgi:general secretion pathway protein E